MQLEEANRVAESWRSLAEDCKEKFLKERNVRRKLHDQLQVGRLARTPTPRCPSILGPISIALLDANNAIEWKLQEHIYARYGVAETVLCCTAAAQRLDAVYSIRASVGHCSRKGAGSAAGGLDALGSTEAISMLLHG
jgi:hypothetical protein